MPTYKLADYLRPAPKQRVAGLINWPSRHFILVTLGYSNGRAELVVRQQILSRLAILRGLRYPSDLPYFASTYSLDGAAELFQSLPLAELIARENPKTLLPGSRTKLVHCLVSVEVRLTQTRPAKPS